VVLFGSRAMDSSRDVPGQSRRRGDGFVCTCDAACIRALLTGRSLPLELELTACARYEQLIVRSVAG